MNNTLWYPYTQMKNRTPALTVEKASGVELFLKDGRVVIDAISSWWCVIHGYNHPELNQAVETQLYKLSHVMLGGLTHQPALDLADKLVSITPLGLNHVFFSDSGSVGCEVAMKMAIQYWKNKGMPAKKKFIALKRGYHGDTLGVMSIGSDDDTMHAAFQDVVFKQYFVSPGNIDELNDILKNHHADIAGFFVEPLMQGAGGFYLHDTLFLQKAKTLCETYNVLFVADEVATGFGRTGTQFAMDQVGVTPDILILGKALTGGYMGLAATLTTTDIFNVFYDDDPSKAFMHGPTFMGNPLACAVALKSIEIFERDHYLDKIKIIETHFQTALHSLTSPVVSDIRIKGAMACLEINDDTLLKSAQEKALSHGVWLRPFGKYLYAMPPYVISKAELEKVIQVMLVCITP